jgi:PPOX class probable F420-dependent enzyme
MKIDIDSKFGARVIERLTNEQIIWLTTVRPDGIPQPNPVWFLWDGDTIVIYSQASAKKVSHVQNNSKVALNFNSAADGDDIVVITGEAHIDPGTPLVTANHAYLEKYRDGIASIGMTPDSMSAAYGTVIRVTPKHVRGM